MYLGKATTQNLTICIFHKVKNMKQYNDSLRLVISVNYLWLSHSDTRKFGPVLNQLLAFGCPTLLAQSLGKFSPY